MFGRVERGLRLLRRVAILIGRRDGLRVRFEESRHVAVEVARFAHAGAYEFGLIGWEDGQGEGAFGVLGLCWFLVSGCTDVRNTGLWA